MMTIQVYTQPMDAHYPAGLAHALHFSILRDGASIPLNSGYPMLFAQGEIGPDNGIVPKNLRDPAMVAVADGYVICARQVDEQTGTPEGLVAWHTVDFLTFRPCEPIPATQTELPIPDDLAISALDRWNPLHSVSVQVPACIHAASPADLDSVQALITYSDGSTHAKQVRWDSSCVDFTAPGRYPVRGTVQARNFPFPCTQDTGDPVLFRWGGRWHFLFTNDATGDVGLYMRRADTLENLFQPGQYEQRLILDVDEERGFIQTFWAPEIHCIGGRLYILLAIGGKMWGPQCHIMALKDGGDPFDPAGWDIPRRICRADGSPLCPGGITLDMTHLSIPSGDYVVWSSRYHCMQPGDSGSMLSIARIDPHQPWHLASEPVLLTRPLLGFENVAGTINNEGPYALLHGGKVYLLYSGGAANSYTYALGQLVADETADLTDLSAWQKESTAVLHFRSIPRVYGPGHHSFFEADGETYIAFHGETSLDSNVRCAGIHRVHFDKMDRPRFDLSHERDLAAAQAQVETIVCVGE